MERYALGLDYGTESARAVLVAVETGAVAATSIAMYADGVIATHLPDDDRQLPVDWALQNPDNWLNALLALVPTVMHESGVRAQQVTGIGIDFTACTLLPTNADGTPLCNLAPYRQQPHAWPKLWKHHAAQPEADAITALATARGEPWLPRYGGIISAEWALPKALEILHDNAELYAAAERLVEAGDWLVWQLTGVLARNACAAGYKGLWHKADGWPNKAYLTALHPALSDLYSNKFQGAVVSPGDSVGMLTDVWAIRLGLSQQTAVAAAMIDAHAGALGGGVGAAGTMFLATGTSTCHMVLAPDEVAVEGIAGVVEDGIVPGFFGYEAGQASSGDILAWFIANSVPEVYAQQALQEGRSIHGFLAERAGKLRPGESGLLALDWWNGCRSTLVNSELSGLVIGITLATKPEAIYRALIEATAFGTRMIIDTFTQQGINISTLIAGGGMARSPLIMQLYADITQRTLAIAGAEQVSAVGAAMLGAVAGGAYSTLTEAAQHMSVPTSQSYTPNVAHIQLYDALYVEYTRLYNDFGRGVNPVMQTLRQLSKNGS